MTFVVLGLLALLTIALLVLPVARRGGSGRMRASRSTAISSMSSNAT